MPWKCNNAFYLHRYVAVNNKRYFAKVSPIIAELIHVGRGKDMTKLIPAFRGNENATYKDYVSEWCLQLIHDPCCVVYCGAYVSLSVIHIAM